MQNCQSALTVEVESVIPRDAWIPTMMSIDDDQVASQGQGDSTDNDWLIRSFDVDGSVDRFLALPLGAMRLVTVSAALIRLHSLIRQADREAEQPYEDYFETIGRRLWVEPYRRLRAVLLTSLEGEPAFSSALEMVYRAFPPSSVLGKAWGLRISGVSTPSQRNLGIVHGIRTWCLDLESKMSLLEDEVKRLGSQEGVDPFKYDVSAFLFAGDTTDDSSVDVIELACNTWQRLLTALPQSGRPSPVANEKNHPSGRRSGRHPIRVDYDIAARAWLELTNEFEELLVREPRGPNQADLCDRLAMRGYRIKPRTLQDRIQKWRAAGFSWPPVPTD